ncbi:uracil-DNA glycosylase family protein [Herbaspirillum sp. RV1423]|uniref:uracil-DNA glycosylase n=1 Tax=Herbaspirillum sp. RV1423 TaxID=1443993 RepID=UPI0004B51061|nr:uracil-DNA glycosylase [Herbaspirillum sp. RV1423]
MSQNTLAAAARVLEEIGVGPVWVRRHLPTGAVAAPEAETAVAVLQSESQLESRPELQSGRSSAASAVQVQPSRQAPPPAAQDDGLPPWLTEMNDADMGAPGFMPYGDEDDVEPAVNINPAIATMDWAKLKETVSDCRQCGLCNGRKKTVFGVGDEKAKWLFIGEGPGRNEDMQGEPFVGPAGKLLDNMLIAMGLKRGDNAYIANIVKCRPTDGSGKDRPPSPQEVASCLPYLQRQIALIQPTVLVALGKTAALSLLGLDPATPVSKLRGTVHRYQGLPLVVTYHPAYLLRQLGDKSKAWADLCLAMTAYADVTH